MIKTKVVFFLGGAAFIQPIRAI